MNPNSNYLAKGDKVLFRLDSSTENMLLNCVLPMIEQDSSIILVRIWSCYSEIEDLGKIVTLTLGTI